MEVDQGQSKKIKNNLHETQLNTVVNEPKRSAMTKMHRELNDHECRGPIQNEQKQPSLI